MIALGRIVERWRLGRLAGLAGMVALGVVMLSMDALTKGAAAYFSLDSGARLTRWLDFVVIRHGVAPRTALPSDVVLALTAIVVTILIAMHARMYWRHGRPSAWLTATLLIALLGNLLNAWRQGFVVDFLWITPLQLDTNLADILGVSGLCLAAANLLSGVLGAPRSGDAAHAPGCACGCQA